MSMFYCIAHDRLEDSDSTGYEVTNAGEEMCAEAYDEMMSDREMGYDAYMAQYDYEPSPYDGTYSEE